MGDRMTCGIHRNCVEILLQLLGIGLSNGAIIALNAIGVTLVYGAVRTINFAYGDLFALATAVVTTVVGSLGLSSGMPPMLLIGGLALALGAGMGLAVLLNVAVERVAFRPFRRSSRLAPLIATIGISFILYQATLTWRAIQLAGAAVHKSDPNNVENIPLAGIPDFLHKVNLVQAAGLKLNVSYTLKDLLVLLIAIVLATLVGWFITRTRFGRAIRACAQDPETAELCGVDRNGIIRLTFALGGALTGASAFIFALYYGRPFGQHGVESGLTAFAAAVLGGIGSPGGAFLSGLLLGVLSAASDYFLAARWTPALILAILIVLLLVRPTGLIGTAEEEDADGSSALWVVAGPSRMDRGRWLTRGLLALGLLYPLIERALGIHETTVVTSILLFALLALGLNILLGFAGLLDLGYAAIFAIGGYTTAMLTDSGRLLTARIPGPIDFLIVLAASAAVAGLFGALNGTLALRLRGEYLAIVTLAFGQLVPRVFLNLDQWTGGARGMSALPPPRLLGHLLATPVERYYLALALVALVALASQRLARSRIGRAWAAMSADETAAASSGVDLARAKLLAFVLGAVVAGITGALFASIFSYVDTEQSDFTVSAMVLAMVIVGGAGSVRGAILGALAIAGYNQLVVPRIGGWLVQIGQTSQTAIGRLIAASDLRNLNYLFFGLALYFTVLFRARDRAGGASVRASGPAPPKRAIADEPGQKPIG
jgi:branched-chain amino acid transport system permease protein